VGGDGPKDAKLVLLGEAPSTEEIRLGSPFVGPAGRVLNLALKAAGIERKRCYITNVVKCCSGRTPTRAEVEFCKDAWLREELAQFGGATVVALGETAWRVFSDDPRGIGEWRGAIVEVEL